MSLQSSLRRPRKKPMAEMNVVPYIDVMLVLLVIFMITAPMLTQGIEVDLPEAEADALSINDQQPLIVTVKANGSFWLQSDPTTRSEVSMQNLPSEIRALRQARGEKLPVLVNGDQRVSYGRVIELMSSLQQAGVTQVGLLTELPSTP
ncbi:cell division and transport-associated protein TolR [Paraperlucidibaca baekdonensis]|uniref:Tol-Pal system protein TolR n=1 Tax=Paraperlucidibaca baekdonensis TaxID=748120 RepID=A0A3E0H2N6_9GAMM|nr:protein TolR [Paraperlucidibaca baekdonensis]REH36778.1 cell division and transport-associated protein TolR [Paraperlucidibaca baekdonensis]